MRHLKLLALAAWTLASACGLTMSAAAPTSLPAPTAAAEVYAAWPFDGAEALGRQKQTTAKLGIPAETAISLPGGKSMLLVLIPAGQFVMGSPEAESLRGRTEFQHTVRITHAFYLAKYVVTQEQWLALMPSNPSLFKTQVDSDRRPVEHVSYKMVEDDYLPRLQACAPAGWKTRLPTEAEWEYACRAGTATAFCFGPNITTDQANYDGARANEGGVETVHRGQTTAVGTFAANNWGLYDMSGNVMQWCQDNYGDFYRKSPPDDPCNQQAGPGKVLRGGCWIHGPRFCRSAARYFAAPDYFAGSIGFRVAMSAATR